MIRNGCDNDDDDGDLHTMGFGNSEIVTYAIVYRGDDDDHSDDDDC